MEIKYFLIHDKLVEFSWPPIISEDILEKLNQVTVYLQNAYGEGIKEIRKGYHTLSLRLHVSISEQDCRDLVEEFKMLDARSLDHSAKTWHIPVAYGKAFGKDLSLLAKIHDLAEEEIIKRHSAGIYVLHFYGFLPGFMYLGGLDPVLFTPRKSKPDRQMSKGSVAIGGHQTGIYPMESPGGWYAIGKCPITLFDIKREPAVQLQVGDRIRFEPIDADSFEAIYQLAVQGKYDLRHD
ncbi:5-oxoprolinase subunit PxpB [Cecembia lonarensis]|uniref:Sporulation inhibitor kipI n=1 Tax=Cecembia lonarensis (strain CCUG 58316 / KCTC 22772 / LW9) TaxID=1225176 RepID=K1KXN2_CECL9|nr:5-oxoprolinase subunit PxpB [Cecembia lonarensis]EKB48850.1 Sporulation inhibitor kipI [Cecembia lonarensis LW9]